MRLTFDTEDVTNLLDLVGYLLQRATAGTSLDPTEVTRVERGLKHWRQKISVAERTMTGTPRTRP